jgi:hypothetical protein
MPSICATFIATIIISLAASAETAGYPACGPRMLKDYSLLGPVKSARVENVEADGRRVLVEQYIFDRSGRLIEDRHAIAADASEHRYQVFHFRYKPKEHNYEIDTFEIDPAQGEQPIELQRHLVKFDSRNRCIEERDLDSDGELSGKNTYAYNGHGDLVRIIGRNSDNSVLSIQRRTYRSDRKLLSEKIIENRGQGLNYQWSREYKYDTRGNQTDLLSYQQGVFEAHSVYQYDERNRLISSQTIVANPQKDHRVYGKCFDCGLSSGETTYQYNEIGQLMEERVFQPGGELVSAKKYLYDAFGNRLPSPDHTYLSDPHGNWIEEIPHNQTSAEIRYRVIEYY